MQNENWNIITNRGDVPPSTIAKARVFVDALLRPICLSVCDYAEASNLGFSYVIYLPHAHAIGEERFLYAGGTRKRADQRYFGSCMAPGYRDAVSSGAIRFIVELSGDNLAACNAAERHLLHGLRVDLDPRFWNLHKGAGAGWGREVAAAAYRRPAFRERGRERALKAAATRRARLEAPTTAVVVSKRSTDTSPGTRHISSEARLNGALKAWRNPAFRAGGSERARKAAATRLRGAAERLPSERPYEREDEIESR